MTMAAHRVQAVDRKTSKQQQAAAAAAAAAAAGEEPTPQSTKETQEAEESKETQQEQKPTVPFADCQHSDEDAVYRLTAVVSHVTGP